MISWLMSRTYKQIAFLMSSLLGLFLMLTGLIVVELGLAAPTVTYWDAIWPPIGIFALTLIGFALMTFIWPERPMDEPE